MGRPQRERVLGALGEGVPMLPHSTTALIRPPSCSFMFAKFGLHWPCDGSNLQTLAVGIRLLSGGQRSKNEAERMHATHSTLGAMPQCQLFSKHWTWRLGAGFRAQAPLFNVWHGLAAYCWPKDNLPWCQLGRLARLWQPTTAATTQLWPILWRQMIAYMKGVLPAKFGP